MKQNYVFEPSKSEIMLTEIVGNSFLVPYYEEFVASLNINKKDKVLDYCSGSGNISKKMVKRLREGELVYVDVSRKWLARTKSKVKSYKMAQGSHLCNFTSLILGGWYNKIVVHFTLHDFPGGYHGLIINQLAKNLVPSGTLFIREPISPNHGIKMHDLINLIESTKKFSYKYSIVKKPLVGEFIDIRCILNS